MQYALPEDKLEKLFVICLHGEVSEDICVYLVHLFGEEKNAYTRESARDMSNILKSFKTTPQKAPCVGYVKLFRHAPCLC